MNDFVALGVAPGAAGIFGLVVGGPLGGFLGLSMALVVGLLAVYTADDEAERIDELEEQVAELRRELAAVRREPDDRDDGSHSRDG